ARVGRSACASVEHDPLPARRHPVLGVRGPARAAWMADRLKSETMNASPQDPLFGPQSRTPVPVEPAFFLVGVAGFEPTTSSSRTKRATKLRHTPWQRHQV